MAVTGIGHLALVVSDMKKSTDFYCGILGFKLVFEIKDANGKPWINYLKLAPGQFVELFYPNGETNPDGVKRIGYSHVCFLVDDMKKTVDEVLARGGVLDRPIKLGADGNYQCWFVDPDGNRMEFMQIMAGSPHAKHS
ncbi:MAG: VOC family protein [Treponemataceae bacterium]